MYLEECLAICLATEFIIFLLKNACIDTWFILVLLLKNEKYFLGVKSDL